MMGEKLPKFIKLDPKEPWAKAMRKEEEMKLASKDVKEVKKVGIKERDILIQTDPPKLIKEVIIRYDPTTKKGRGISQIIDGLGRIIK